MGSRLNKILLICVITLLAILARVWELSKTPPLIVDEYANLKMLNEIIKNKTYSITEFHWDFSKTILPYYPTILFIKFLRLENNLFTLRLTSVIYSLLAVLAFYLILRGLTKEKISLLTTLLFSSSYFFLQFSRVDWVDIIFVVATSLWAFFFLDLGLKTSGKKSILFIILSSFLSGLIFYGYRAGTIFIALLFLYLFFSLYLNKKMEGSLNYFVIFTLVFTFVTLPWIIKISKNLQKYNLRARVVDIRNV